MYSERAALARSILIFFVGLGAAGLVLAVLNAPFDTFVGISSDMTTSTQAAQGRQYMETFWNALPFIIVFLSFFQLLAAAAAERRLPGQ